MLRLNNNEKKLKVLRRSGNILIDAIVGTAILLSISVAIFFTLEVNERNYGLNKQKSKNNQALDYVIKELKYNYTYDQLKVKAIDPLGVYKFNIEDLTLDNLKSKELFLLCSQCSSNYISLKFSDDLYGNHININLELSSSLNGINLNKTYSLRKVKN
ncbi:hypothetical protein [Clostridium folliculivorans]|uniref:Uncharacterized protein n=1 Tax=Clostridium folliculivorans TaxID=2886038 RepID=A0A9W5XZJ6_9CLOT|nr:hypothetical protein [Clostridium folliculivorans]GKU23979.1 hypothetical protein CFOLD11_08050 [Clostridium folliculivorans]GKU30094.1 hypothetical protein CFB3_22010 [Clostridium folliculivorans]